MIAQTFDRIRELLELDEGAARALARFSEDGAVRILTIHKCKGLEFDSVIVIGVENETFWGEPDAERSAYFVAISRAKRRLYLTVAERREKPQGANRRWRVARSPHKEGVAQTRTNGRPE
ncbi:MAG TPA: 3'-5' exonuclease [Thermoanaerobaculia bacterium]|nr:3'-5' exonuclease [Thermoanaerobaculia bacterium]